LKEVFRKKGQVFEAITQIGNNGMAFIVLCSMCDIVEAGTLRLIKTKNAWSSKFPLAKAIWLISPS